jgi:hypothetical protein
MNVDCRQSEVGVTAAIEGQLGRRQLAETETGQRGQEAEGKSWFIHTTSDYVPEMRLRG